MNNRITILVIGLVLFLCAYNQEARAQYIMSSFNNTITDCEGTIESRDDENGNYYNNVNAEQTICSGNGQCIQIVFNEFETASIGDKLTIYDGPDTFADVIGNYWGDYQIDTIRTSGYSDGCITLQFTTNDSLTSIGFFASFTCIPCPAVYALGEGTDTIIGCTADLWDSGIKDFYLNNENITQTFCPTDSGQCLTLTFSSFNTEADVDILSIYDGPSINAPLIGNYSGTRKPDIITSSASGGGCLTFTFISNDTIQKTGFLAKMTCGLCREPSLILGQADSTIGICGNKIYDSGFLDSYGNNENYSQTICSDSIGECITLSFPYFYTEATFDRLKIYEGSSTSGELLATYSGINIPPTITSSSNSDGCLTLVFISNNSIVDQGFRAEISCGLCSEDIANPSVLCATAQPFCTEITEGYTFLGHENSPSELEYNAGCLLETDNAVWYYLQIQDSGSIELYLSSDYDVDFICWGPFDETHWNASICDSISSFDWVFNSTKIVDCSFSVDNVEHCMINNAAVGEFYLLLITNYSNIPSLINIRKIDGDGSSNCSYLCDNDLNYSVSNCDSTNNTYSINGTMNILHPPLYGNLSLTNSSGGSLSYSAPFPDTLIFNFNQLASDGQLHEIQFSFSDALSCNQSYFYTAPVGCNTCLVTAATIDSIHCQSLPIEFMATEIQGAEYSWTGPNGFTSSAQNPIIQSAEFNMSGTYQVSVFNPSDSCLSIASVNVFVHPYPIDVSITGNIAVCAGDSLILHTTQYSNAEYTWYKSGNVYSHDTMLIFQPANTGNQGIYSCSINIEGCINSSAEEEVFVYPNPVNPILLFDPLYNSLQAFPIGGNFQWYLGEDLIVGQTYDTLQLELTGNYMVILTNEFGCTASSQYFVYDPTGIPELPISRLALQPNPARDFIQVLVPELGVLEVLDLAGKRVKENKLLLGLNSISVNELAAGIYLFQFHSNSGVRIAKVIVEHNY